jgi:hypothetical protein
VGGHAEAQAKARESMATINRSDYGITSQINFGRFPNEYLALHVGKLAVTIAKHIRPAFERLMLCEIEPVLVRKGLDAKDLS